MLLLDGHSLAYRAFFALPVENFNTTTGQPTNAVYGFTSMLINVLRDERPTHVGVAFDLSRQTFRLAEYPEYKAKRNKTPGEFSSQLPLIQEVLSSFRIPFLHLEGYEADDIIATWTEQALGDGMEVLILTGDRDSLQLVTESSTVLYPMRGVSELARMTPAAVVTKYGVSPDRYPELAALVGEDSDNLPGIPGVGPKTAAKWIEQFDGLDNVIARADEVAGKAGESLRAHLGDVIRNRHLNRLVRDLDLSLTPADMALQSSDRNEVHTLFDGLEFRVLRERLLETPEFQALREQLFGISEADAPVQDDGFELSSVTLAAGELGAWLETHSPIGKDTRVGVSVRGSWRAGTGEVWSIGLAANDGNATWIDAETVTPEDEAVLAAWLADPARAKVMHDAKGPMQALVARGWPLHGLVSDTALAAYIVRPDQRSYDLADLSVRYLKRELKQAAADTGQLSFDTLDTDNGQTLMLDARAVVDLAEALDQEVAAHGGTALLADVELPLVDLLAQMERTGIAADTELLEALEAEFAGEVRRAAEEAFSVIGKEINLGSPKQLQVVLFDELAMPKTKRTKTGYTTDADALQQLFEKTEHPFLMALLRHRDVTRLRQTVEGLLKTVSDDGRIHTTFNQLIAATGRLSSTDPNLQNIPVRTEEGRRIRETFIVGEGFDCLMTADCRLQPDRDADHGAPVRGCAADRGVPQRSGLPLDDGIPGLRSRRGRRHDRHASQDQGDELRPRLRLVGVRPGPAVAHRAVRSAGADGRVLRDIRRHSRLPRRRRRRGPPIRLHRDDHGSSALPARPDQRQPSATRDGRADGLERTDPGLGGRPDQGGDAQRRTRDGARRDALEDVVAGP